jgi:glycerate 2-kinase
VSALSDPPKLLRDLFDVAVEAVQARNVMQGFFPSRPKGRLIVLGAGKAAGAMAEATEGHYGAVEGLVIAPEGYARPCTSIEVVEASHPVPDARGSAAAARILALAESAGPDDLVLCLISGGASALMALPAPGITLADKRALTRALLKSGATINEINCVRKHLSAIKGGRLAQAAAPARVVSLIVSDVVGDDPAVIASGPTVADPTTCADALAVLTRYRIDVPAEMRALLERGRSESPKAVAADVPQMIATPKHAFRAAAQEARDLGLAVHDLGDACEGEARAAAAEQAALVRRIVAGKGPVAAPCVILSGGEFTVTIVGEGRGGPNTEFALALALALDGLPGVWALSGDTDGRDGNSGVAGAVVHPDTLQRARGADPAAALARNDSAAVFQAIGDLLDPGPTCTNVNDFRAILVLPPV